LDNIQTKLKELDQGQYKLLQLALKGFPEAMVEMENKKYNDQRAALMQWKADLEVKKEQGAAAADHIKDVKAFCELARQNLDNFTHEDKRLALGALGIRVMIDRDNVMIEGAIPIGESGILVSPISRRGGTRG
jgi:hypothetical protein